MDSFLLVLAGVNGMLALINIAQRTYGLAIFSAVIAALCFLASVPAPTP